MTLNLRAVDLFSGIGGFRQATLRNQLQSVDFKMLAASDIDSQCQSVYQSIFSTGVSDEIFIPDVNRIQTKDIEANSETVTLPDFDILFAGFPCQTFSNIGKRAGFGDERGMLFFKLVKILETYQPTFFILENVQKIATLDKGAVLKQMVSDLSAVGYEIHVWDLTAEHYGLPQQRRRIFFCGVHNRRIHEKLDLPPPPQIPREEWKYPTVWHLLEREMPAHHLIPPRTRLTVLRKNPKWMGDLQIDRPIARPLTATMAKWHRANQDNYYSIRYIRCDNPDPYSSPKVDLDTEPIRRITPLEGLRLQGFPDTYASTFETMNLNWTSTYRLIGNAVPVTMAASVLEHFLGAYL